MANKTIQTRIQNKIDVYSNGSTGWYDKNPVLLNGEIAIVKVPTGTTYTNPVTGADEPVIELLMKVGDGVTPFNTLPWMSAKASDVYDWAKGTTAEGISVKDNRASGAETKTLANWFKDLTEADADLDSRMAALEGGKIDLAVIDTETGKFMTDIAYDAAKGEFTVSRADVAWTDLSGELPTEKLPTIPEGKISSSVVSHDGSGEGNSGYTKVSDAIEGLHDRITTNTGNIAALEGKLENVANVMDFVGAYEDAPTTAQKGDVYVNTSTEKEYVYDGSEWVEFGNVSAQQTAIEKIINGQTTVKYASNAINANKALSDNLGNRIDTTYATKDELTTVNGVAAQGVADAAAAKQRADEAYALADAAQQDINDIISGKTAVYKALCDNLGQMIHQTYATKSDLNKIDAGGIKIPSNPNEETPSYTTVKEALDGHETRIDTLESAKTAHDEKLNTIEANYVKFVASDGTNNPGVAETGTLQIGSDTIIFDCGNATILI